MSRKILAIDIRNQAIAALLFNTGIANHGIEKSFFLPFDGKIPAAQALRSALSEITAQIEIGGLSTVVALPAERAFYRRISVPFKDDKKIRQILPFEIEPDLPFPVENLVIDYQKSATDQRGEVMTVAMEKNDLHEFMDILSTAGLTVQLVVPGAFALVNRLIELDPQMPDQALIMDVDHQKASLFAIHDGRVAMVRSISSALDELKTETAVQIFSQRVRQTIRAFADSQSTPFDPSMIYLCGPAIGDASHAKAVSHALELPTQTVDMLSLLPKINLLPEAGRWNPFIFDNTLALADLETTGKPCPSFHRSSSPLRDLWLTYGGHIKVPAILAAVVLLLSVSGVLVENWALKRRIKRLDSAIVQIYKQSFPDASRIVEPVVQMRTRIEEIKKASVEGGLAGVSVRNIDILQEISRLIAKEPEVIFDRLTAGDGSVMISGETAAFNVVDDVKSRLSGSAMFKQVTIASANMDKAGNKVKFKLKIDL